VTNADDNTFAQNEPKDPTVEDLLWQLSSVRSLSSAEPASPPIEDHEIERYRRGEMSATERRQFERRLASDEHGMGRLARVVTRPAMRRPSTWRLAASIAIGALATAGLFFSLQDRRDESSVFELPSYTVTVQGLSERRGFDPEDSFEALPGSTVRIVARPATKPAPNLEFAFYRHGKAGLLTRIPQMAARIEVVRGTAVLEAEATALVGDEPALHELLLMIGPEGFEPPASLEEAAVDPLARAEGVQIHSFELRLLSADGGDRSANETGTNSATKTTALSWEFYAAPCPDAVSLYSASCGAYGELHFEVVSSSCQPFDSGAEVPFGYPGHEIGELSTRQDPVLSGGRGVIGELEKLPARAPATGPWSALIDWEDAHGLAVGAVTDALSGPATPAIGYYLDDFSLLALGAEIGDQHLLVKLCEVANDVDTGTADLKTLGMSLGRVPQPTDPVAGSTCAGTLSCHVRGLLGHLKDRNVTIAAAAGNHQQLLFPAVLDEALAVGGLDMGKYFNNGALHRVWESPTQYDAILPGYALCVGGSVVPSGSSLSTAFLAGGLARLLDEVQGIDPYAAGPWVTTWSTPNDCIVLAQDGVEHPYCNPEIDSLMSGLMLGAQSGCWDAPVPANVLVAPPPGTAVAQPPAPGLVQWVADKLKPAPEEDPCIPCMDDDSYPPFTNDVFLNTTRSMPLSSHIYLDALFVRTGTAFYQVNLTPQELESVARAQIDGLNLPGFGAILDPASYPSLYYLLKMDPALDCSEPTQANDCFWSSTYAMP
jgi:hypothetical protein